MWLSTENEFIIDFCVQKAQTEFDLKMNAMHEKLR